MNIGALLALTKPQTGQTATMPQVGFDAALAQTMAADSSSWYESLLLSTNGASTQSESALPMNGPLGEDKQAVGKVEIDPTLSEVPAVLVAQLVAGKVPVPVAEGTPPPGVAPTLAAKNEPPGIVQMTNRGEEFAETGPNAPLQKTDLPTILISKDAPPAEPSKSADSEVVDGFTQLLSTSDLGVKVIRVDASVVPPQTAVTPQGSHQYTEVERVQPNEGRESLELKAATPAVKESTDPTRSASSNTVPRPIAELSKHLNRHARDAECVTEPSADSQPVAVAKVGSTSETLESALDSGNSQDASSEDKGTGASTDQGLSGDDQTKYSRHEAFISRQENLNPNHSNGPLSVQKQERTELLKAAADRIELLAATKSAEEVTVHLAPSDLGEIKLVLHQKEGGVEAQVYSQDDRVRHLLAVSQADLSRSLDSRGLKLESFHVSTFQDGGQEASQRGNQSHLSHQQSQPRYSVPQPVRVPIARVKTSALDLAI